MPQFKDYTTYSFYLTVLVIILVLCAGFIPSFEIMGFSFRRVNILSDIVRFDDSTAFNENDDYFDTTFLGYSKPEITSPEIDSLHLSGVMSSSWYADSSVLAVRDSARCAADTERVYGSLASNRRKVTPIIDYSPDSSAMSRFYDLLATGKEGKPIRVAVLGDSFIEGDIITADLREMLQQLYGGRGVGFLPYAMSATTYMTTVKHSNARWTNYNILGTPPTPTQYREQFFISGAISIPSENAASRYRGVTFRKNLKNFSRAKLLFKNENQSQITITVNDTIKNTFTPESSPHVQELNVYANFGNLRVSVSQPDGFIGYGITLEDSVGISVDNFSLRSNTGVPILSTDRTVNRQIDHLLGYDLIIVQYGLNAITPSTLGYNNYSKQLTKIIGYLRECFPQSCILVVSVGDRSTMSEGSFVTMPAIPGMIAAQEKAARESGVAFWNMYKAMGGAGSMVGFVERGWAAKDYTHLGYPGGKVIARELVRALLKGKHNYENPVPVIMADSVNNPAVQPLDTQTN